MAKRLAIPSQHVALRLIGPKDSYFASRVQRLNVNNDIPTTDVEELGNPNRVGVVRDIPNITVGFSVYDVSHKVWSVLTGTDPTAYPAWGIHNTALGEADVALYIRDADVADYAKSAHARRLQVRDFTFNYSVDGESTEDYTLIGSERRWLKYDVIVDRFTSGTTTFTLTQTPLTLKNGNKLLTVTLDGEYLTEVAAGPATGEYSVSGTALTTGDTRTAQVIAVYHANPAGSNWTDIGDTTIPAAIRGRDVEVKISANAIDRVQSVTINGSMNTQPVREMGNRVILGYQKQVPSVEGTITVLDTDTELIDLLTTGSINSGDTEFLLGEGCVTSGLKLQVELLDPCDTVAPYLVLKTVVVSGLLITGDSFTSNVGNNATQTFNWRSTSGSLIVFSGSAP